MITKAPKGTADILPSQAYKWQYIENEIRKICNEFCIKEIRTPVFEHTELFERGVGETTDVVGKEMYTFNDKGGRSITLRPEGTASAARAYIEHGLFNEPQPVKVFYQIKCYRYEKPQAGRYREFSQFGVEVYGSAEPSEDAEIMALPMILYKRLGLKNLRLSINSIGCPKCRKEYNKKLKEYLAQYYDDLCDTCKERFEKNPMRIIDCKSPVCGEIVKGAPKLIDCICEECAEHFDRVKKNLDAMGIAYELDPYIVRGLDYYTKTVFEIIAENTGSVVCGGGRYDGLIEELGGNPMPACGFALGMERLILALEEQGIEIPDENGVDIYIGNIGEESGLFAQKLVTELRETGISAEKDHLGKSVKAQMKYANKIGARFSVVVGDNELAEGFADVKNMDDGTQTKCALNADEIIKIIK